MFIPQPHCVRGIKREARTKWAASKAQKKKKWRRLPLPDRGQTCGSITRETAPIRSCNALLIDGRADRVISNISSSRSLQRPIENGPWRPVSGLSSSQLNLVHVTSSMGTWCAATMPSVFFCLEEQARARPKQDQSRKHGSWSRNGCVRLDAVPQMCNHEYFTCNSCDLVLVDLPRARGGSDDTWEQRPQRPWAAAATQSIDPRTWPADHPMLSRHPVPPP